MKNKIIFLIIGFLIGAIVTTLGFFIYLKTVQPDRNQPGMMQMDENGQRQGPGGNTLNGEMPEMPNGNNAAVPGEQASSNSTL